MKRIFLLAMLISIVSLTQKVEASGLPALEEHKLQPITFLQPKEEPKPVVVEYVVQPGDNLTKIATAHNTTVERLFAKNLTISHPDVIKAGDKLVLPQADEILEARPLPAIIVSATTPQLLARKSPQISSGGNSYSYGYCTYFVKGKRPDIPNSWGDAVNWYSNAQRMGWATGSTPKVGAIAWARNYGHVAYVIGVNGNSVTVEEMNYRGWNITSTRISDTSEWLYIY